MSNVSLGAEQWGRQAMCLVSEANECLFPQTSSECGRKGAGRKVGVSIVTVLPLLALLGGIKEHLSVHLYAEGTRRPNGST